ncbi:hypothetical protein, partial [Escherichia coli]|uniref:hypothetical protein n=1 Tax=Escherichia coli TaxID=562 RepID=UPI001BC8C03B
VPAYGPQNDVTLKMPAFEWVHVQLHQQKGMISLSPPTICNSAVSVIQLNGEIFPWPGWVSSVISEHIFSVSSGLVFTVISRQTLLCKGSTAIHRRMETRLFFQ